MTKEKLPLLLFILFITGSILLCACSGKAPAGSDTAGVAITDTGEQKALAKDGADSPQHTVQCVMNSLKTLDLDTFNAYTDNYISTTRNLIGFPTAREYRVFNELLQPSLIKGKHYKRNYRLSQKLTQDLSWEITDVRQSGQSAQVDIDITNLDMSLATGKYVVFLLENMTLEKGLGLGSLMRDLSDLSRDMDGFLSVIESLGPDDTCTIAVTLSLFQDGGKWKLHVSDEFINAFMGNINSEEYPEEITERIEALEKEMEDNAEKWAEDFETRADSWAERFEDTVEGLFD